ncbi:MAG: GTPase Era [Deltaproteobacteria bacterium]|jgi:GTP-binding protein Era|nr:GTPase Era [Deltaproteobacteria bacterium]
MTHDKEHRCGWVAIMGPPNAGKSTLLNALIGQKVSIVTPRAQTTRNRIVGILNEPGAQIMFMDTPGLTRARGHLPKMMLQSVWQSMDTADVLLLILDCDLYLRKPEFLERDTEALARALAVDARPLIGLVNKVDKFADKSRMLPLLERLQSMWPKAELFPASALLRDGLPELAALIVKKLPAGPAQFPEEQLSTASVRFMAAEIIREKLFLHLVQEVPYSVAVEIEIWEDMEDEGRTLIHAAIYVGRPSHKAMVIGKGGAGIKAIGSSARQEIQALLERKVHLELWVKVREHWTEDPHFMRSLGLGPE